MNFLSRCSTRFMKVRGLPFKTKVGWTFVKFYIIFTTRLTSVSFDFCVFYSETISGTCFTLYPLKSLASYYITAFYSRVWRLPLYCT